MTTEETATGGADTSIAAIRRPHPNLLKFYVLRSLAGTIFFPVLLLPAYFKYHTLRYRFDDEGISASWGILFKREIYLTYRRIQDIHVTRNVIERWLGIGRVDIQTASGSAAAELSLEGMDRYDDVRDFLYGKMRGTAPGDEPRTEIEEGEHDTIRLLGEIKDELEGVRRALEAKG